MKYDIIVCDPPWNKKKGGIRKSRPHQGTQLDYETMSTYDIFQLLDREIFIDTSKNHCVFMWCIDQFLFECEREMEKRHYKKHCRFVWNKLNGIAPAFTVRYCHEYLIWFYKEKLLPIDPAQRGKYMTVFSEKSREHSRKPNYCYEMIDILYPDRTKIDVFSREKRIGWEQFGNQTDYFNK